MKKLAPLVLCLWAWGTLVAACRTPLPEPTVEQKETAAGASYTSQLVACTSLVSSVEADKCAAEVRKEWHRLPDGGKDVSR